MTNGLLSSEVSTQLRSSVDDLKLLGLKLHGSDDRDKRLLNNNNNHRHDRGKESLTVDISKGTHQPKQKAPHDPKPKETFSYGDEVVVAIFDVRVKSSILSLPDIRIPEEADKINDPK